MLGLPWSPGCLQCLSERADSLARVRSLRAHLHDSVKGSGERTYRRGVSAREIASAKKVGVRARQSERAERLGGTLPPGVAFLVPASVPHLHPRTSSCVRRPCIYMCVHVYVRLDTLSPPLGSQDARRRRRRR